MLRLVSTKKKPPRTETVTLTRLRKKMAEVETLAQFERIIAKGHPDHRGAMRKLLEPMLTPGLPCCGQAELARRVGQEEGEFTHGARCPRRNRVVLH